MDVENSQLPYTYSGLMDDVVQRYSLDVQIDDDLFNRILAKNAFFSGGILINDGYLMLHPVARKELLREGSLLRSMLRSSNFARVLSREPTADALADMPIRMAAQNIATYEQFIKSTEWHDFRQHMRGIAHALFRSSNIVRWPNRAMHVGFVNLIDEAFAQSPQQLELRATNERTWDAVRADFHSRDPRAGSPRDKFEKAVLNMVPGRVDDAPASRAELMKIANQCYHYNFGMCVQSELSWRVTVDTFEGPAFRRFIVPPSPIDDELYRAVQKIPSIRIPKSFPFQTGSVFDELLEGSGTKVGRAKLAYIAALENIFHPENRGNDEVLRQAQDVADEYNRRIQEHFARYVGSRFWEAYVDTAIAIGSGMLAAPLGLVAGIVLAIATNELTRQPRQFLLRRIISRQLKNEMDTSVPPLEASKYFTFRPAELRPAFASLGFNERSAAAFAETVPPLRSN